MNVIQRVMFGTEEEVLAEFYRLRAELREPWLERATISWRQSPYDKNEVVANMEFIIGGTRNDL